MTDFNELTDRRPRRHARRLRLGRGARSPGTWPPTSTPSAVAFVESADDVAATVRFAADNGLKVAGQGTGHGAVALAPLDEHDPGQDRAHARDRGRRRTRRPPGSRPASSRWSWARRPARTASARCPAPRPDVGVIGYTARRRPQLARARATASPATGSRAIELVTADGEPRTRRRARTTPTSSGPCAAAAAATRSSPPCTSTLLPIAEVYARRPGLPGRARRRARSAPTATGPRPRPTRSPRSSASLTPPPIPDVPEPLRGVPLLTIDGACIGSQAAGEASDRAAARDRRDDHGHLRPDAGRRPLPHPHGPRAAGARARRTGADRRAARRGDRRLRRHVAGPESGSPLLLSRAAPARRRPRPAAPRTAAPSPSSTPPSSCTASGCR